jgi:three-Cys-motif partner protein
MSEDFDEIGYWSELKLEIIEKYARAYSTILSKNGLHHSYIDGFAGAGTHISKGSGDQIPGSPRKALGINPPFVHYYFIDLNGDKTQHLRGLAEGRSDVTIFQGDCNEILLDKVFPHCQWNQYRRALCVLDPYGLHLNWEVIFAAGQSKSIDMILNFPIMDMNRNAVWRNPEKVSPKHIQRMNKFWGDESWRKVAYAQEETLFGPDPKKVTNDEFAAAFRLRLQQVAGFQSVPEPIPMKTESNATIYYLFFASQKPVAANIMSDIFNKYRDWKAPNGQ